MNKKPVIFILALLAVALVVIVVFLNRTDPFGNARPSPEALPLELPQDADHGDELGEAMKVFGQSCASCHGNFGQGQPGFPSLQNCALPDEEIRSIIKSGKGDMPAFDHIEEPLLTRLVKFVKML